ncbi:NAD(P)/FAD-dependent oxidoreductase, partial [Anaplasma marginale]
MKATGMGKILADRTGASLDRSGRVIVAEDFKVSGYDNIFAIGDLARYDYQDDKPLPGVAPVAMQEGQYVARLIKSKLNKETIAPFYYFDSGSLAVIG